MKKQSNKIDEKSTNMAPKSVPEALLEGSGCHLGPKSQQDLNKSPKSQFAGPLLTPKLEAKLDPKRTKLGPNCTQVCDFVDLCVHLCVHARPRSHQSAI